MKIRLVHRLFLAGLLAGGVIPCIAQQTIVLSKPTDMSADKANNFMDNRSNRVNNDHNAPRSLFNSVAPEVPMPPPRQYIPYQDPSVQEALNKRKNWTLLTPEEILGIPTPEQIMGVPADKTKPKLSLEEKFLLRQQSGATNGRVASLFSKEDNNPFSQKRADRNSQFYSSETSPSDRLNPDTDRYFEQLKKMAAQDPFSSQAIKKEESPWASGFANPTAPKRTPEQLAAMERFRAMLEPVTPQPAMTASRVSVAAPDPYLQPQPKVNPNGHSVESLENNSARPTGITPLPTVTGSAPKTTKRPDWQAKPPPWASGKPQTIEQKRANFY